MNDQKVISWVERLGASKNGNPYFRAHFTDGTSARTQIDSMINYSIENSENIGVPVLLSLTRAGRIYDIKKDDRLFITACISSDGFDGKGVVFEAEGPCEAPMRYTHNSTVLTARDGSPILAVWFGGIQAWDVWFDNRKAV